MKSLFPGFKGSPRGPNMGVGGLRTCPKCLWGWPHTRLCDARCSPKSRNVVLTTQNPGTIVHDIPNPQVKILRLQVLLKSSVSYYRVGSDPKGTLSKQKKQKTSGNATLSSVDSCRLHLRVYSRAKKQKTQAMPHFQVLTSVACTSEGERK